MTLAEQPAPLRWSMYYLILIVIILNKNAVHCNSNNIPNNKLTVVETADKEWLFHTTVSFLQRCQLTGVDGI